MLRSDITAGHRTLWRGKSGRGASEQGKCYLTMAVRRSFGVSNPLPSGGKRGGA